MTNPGPPLLPVRNPGDVPPAYRNTAVADLLAYHNRGAPHRHYATAELLVGMCIDHRKRLRIPENFAFVMRAAGANFRGLEFQMSFAIAIGGVRAIALIGHDQCGMVGLRARRGAFIDGLTEGAGLRRDEAESHFDRLSPRFQIDDPVEFVCSQARHLRQQYPRVIVAPLMYGMADGMLYRPDEPGESV